MHSQLDSSVMQQAYTLTYDVLSQVLSEVLLMVCAGACFLMLWQRRQPKQKPALQKPATHAHTKKTFKSNSDDSSRSTEAGDSSSTDGSVSVTGRTRAPFSTTRGRKAPGLTAPAPLDAPNAEQLRGSIQALKGALTEWGSKLPTTNKSSIAPLAEDKSNALLAALAKLTPEQATTVRSMLDSKLGVQPQRTFTPFQGTSKPWNRPNRANPWDRPNHATIEAPRHNNGPEEESLQTHLKELALIDDARILMLRKINRLGLHSAQPLEDYFSRFGSIERVMVAPTMAKHRVRAAPLGFVVMSTAESVSAALAHGAEHLVAGESISVYAFKSHSI